MQEVWKSVKGYDDRFMISSEGRLSNCHTGKILSQNKSKRGYFEHSTKIGGRNGKSVLLRIHRLVAEAFLEPPSQELLDIASSTVYGLVPVNHKDGNKTNNKPENLEWCTQSENVQHSYDIGLQIPIRGVSKSTSKLERDDILFIRKHYIPFDREYGARALAEKYGVHHSVICNVHLGKSYQDVI